MARLAASLRAATVAIVAIAAPAVAHGEPPTPPGAAVKGSADDDAGRRLQATLRAHGADVYGCWDKALAAGPPSLHGEVLVRIVVVPGGAVTRAEVLEDETGSRVLSACLQSAMRGWSAPDLAGAEPQQYVFPLAFKPEAAHASAAPRVALDGGQTPAPTALASAPDAAAAPSPTASLAPAPPPTDEGARRYVVPYAQGGPGPLGRGRVEARVLLDAQTVGPTQASLTVLKLHPTARLALHTHPGSLELLYVDKGMARLRDGSGGLTVGNEGDVLVAPAGLAHNVESAPLAPLTLVQIFAPAGPEHAYRDPRDRSLTVPVMRGRAAKPWPGEDRAPVTVVRGADARAYPIAGGRAQASLFLDSLPIGEASLQRIDAPAGAVIPSHEHDRSDEIWYVLSGRAELSVHGEKHLLKPGDAVHVPMGVAHSLAVTERLVALQCFAPAGPEQREKRESAAGDPAGETDGRR